MPQVWGLYLQRVSAVIVDGIHVNIFVVGVCCSDQVIHDICTKLALNYNAGGLPWPWNWLRLMLWPPSYQDLTAGQCLCVWGGRGTNVTSV